MFGKAWAKPATARQMNVEDFISCRLKGKEREDGRECRKRSLTRKGGHRCVLTQCTAVDSTDSGPYIGIYSRAHIYIMRGTDIRTPVSRDIDRESQSDFQVHLTPAPDAGMFVSLSASLPAVLELRCRLCPLGFALIVAICLLGSQWSQARW